MISSSASYIQIAPVLERLVFPRSKNVVIDWLDTLISLKVTRWLIPAHYSAPIEFTPNKIKILKKKIINRAWANDEGNWRFLDSLDNALLDRGVVPKDPQKIFKD